MQSTVRDIPAQRYYGDSSLIKGSSTIIFSSGGTVNLAADRFAQVGYLRVVGRMTTTTCPRYAGYGSVAIAAVTCLT